MRGGFVVESAQHTGASCFCKSQPYPELTLTKLPRLVADVWLAPSTAFVRFIRSVDLHQRMRSVTDCYFDLADRTVTTAQPHAGYLLHFMSDSQWCLHWYLHVTDNSETVLSSESTYGFDWGEDESAPDAPWRKNEIDLGTEESYFSAPSFPEFIYRFWLENELWFPLSSGEKRLVGIQAQYAEHYRTLKR
jgi:hypothetical protein